MAVIQHALRITGLQEAAAGLESVGDAAAKTGRQLSSGLADGIDEAGKQAGKLGQGLGILSPTLGSLAMGVADAADGLLALATPSGMAIAAVVGLSAAAVGGVAAIAGLVVGLGQATLAADEALKSLEGFKLIGSDIYPAVPPATLQSIKEANAAVDSLLSIFQLMVVEVGGNVAPAFASMGKAAVGAGLEVLDAIRAITDSQSVLRLVAVGAVHAISAPLFALLQPLAAIQDGYAALADVVGVEVAPAMRDNLKQVEALHLRFSQAVVDTVDLSAQSSVLAGLYGELEQRGGAFVDQQIRATSALEAAKNATDGQAEAMRKLKDEQRKAAEELHAYVAAYEAAAAAVYAKTPVTSADIFKKTQTLTETLVPPDALTAFEQLDLLSAEIAVNLSRGTISLEQFAALSDSISATRGRLQAAQGEANLIATANQVGGVAGALSGGVGGIAGAVSQIGTMAGAAAAGPIVAAIMQIIQLVTAIVPEDGGQGLLDQIHATIMEFFGDIGELPGVLARFMQDTIREGIPAMFDVIPSLIEGLIAAIPELIVATVEQFPLMIGGLLQMLIVGIPKAILEGIGALFSADLWKGLVDAMIQGFKEMFAPIFGNKETGEKGAFAEGGYFDQVFVGPRERRRGERTILGSRASGDDYIGQTGLYLMHKGETVSGNGRLAPATSGSSGGTTVVIQGSVYGIDDLARAMREARRRGVSFG